ncbi:ribonuclease HII [Amaricoccus tamworthensis]|uniref:ribonuclease HII n=1 Tax=Amaricoccus tamworthensis TaxID=57002 RepID=UPI003C7BB747
MTGTLPDLSLELEAISSGHARIAGVDEVGRGPWSGPVVAAAVILDPDNIPAGLNDSKKLTAARRESLMAEITACAAVGIGEATVAEIDEVNILQASFLAMRRALDNLTTPPDFVLVDGRHIPPGLPCQAQAVIKGDGRSLSIAAASIVAKVTRDRIMVALSQQFPGYAWETNMGYGTKAHVEGLNLHGVTQHHRRSFKPIHNMLRKAKSLSA